jgi:hypothetical protein
VVERGRGIFKRVVEGAPPGDLEMEYYKLLVTLEDSEYVFFLISRYSSANV